MLTPDEKQRMDEAAEFYKFRDSSIYQSLKKVLEEYRERAIEEVEHAGEDFQGPVRRLHAANELIDHVEATIEEKTKQLEDVAAERGVDMNELRIRREIYDAG